MRFLFILSFFFLSACSSVEPTPVEVQPTNIANQENTKPDSPAITPSKSDADNQYKDLVTKIRVLPGYDDVQKLKDLYIHTQYYQPFIGEEAQLSEQLQQQLTAKQWQECIITSKQLLEANYLSLNGHYFYMACAIESKQVKLAKFHKTIFNYLLDVMWNSGDGLTPDTAIKSISTAEIDSLLKFAGLQVNSRSLLEHNGKSYERIEVRDSENSRSFELYFDVSVAWEYGFKQLPEPAQ